MLSILQTALHHSPAPLLSLTPTAVLGGRLTGAGKDIVHLGYLMVNDLFNVEEAETTVVLRKLLR